MTRLGLRLLNDLMNRLTQNPILTFLWRVEKGLGWMMMQHPMVSKSAITAHNQ